MSTRNSVLVVMVVGILAFVGIAAAKLGSRPIAQIKDLLAPARSDLAGLSEQEELARIKEDWLRGDARSARPSRLEELARLKDQVGPVGSRPTGPSRLELLERIKGDFTP